MRPSSIDNLLPHLGIGLLTLLLGLAGASPAEAAPAPAQLLSLGKCLSTAGDASSDGTAAVISTCAGRSGQNWQLPPRGFSGPIVGPGGKCLDVTGSNPADRTPVILFSCHGLANQSWRHELDGRIVGLGNKCLDVLESGSADGTAVVLFQCNATPNQLWTPEQRNYFHSEPLLSEAWLFSLAASPAQPDRIFAAASTNGILRSENGGLDWASANAGVRLGAGVQEVVVDPQRPDDVYALENGRLLRSRDGGKHFIGQANLPGGLRSLAVDPRRPGRVLALDGNGFFESTDRGEYWRIHNFPFQQSPDTLQQLLIDPLVPGRLWIAAAATCAFCTGPDQGVFRSDNDGETWNRVFVLPSRRLVADPHASGNFYALVDNQLHRTTNSGITWQLLGNFGGSLTDVWVDSAFPGQLVVAHHQGLSRSVDGGVSFVPVALDLRPGPTGFPAEYVRRFLYTGGRLLAAVDALDGHPGRGVIASTDFGATWTLRSQRLFAAGHIVDIDSVAGAGPRIWATGRDGVYLSNDGGVHYTRKLATDGPAEATALLVDPYDPTGNTIFVTATRFPGPGGPFLWKSTNGGNTWEAPAGADGQQIETGGFLATQFGGKKIYLTTLHGSLGGTLYRGILSSEDGAGPWKPLNLGVRVRLLAKSSNDAVLYAAGDALLRSADGGNTWLQIQSLPVDAMATFGNELFLVNQQQFFTSTNQGLTLTATELPDAIRGPSALLVTADRIYLGDRSGGLYASADRGHTWTALDLGLPQTLVNVMHLDPRDPGRMLVGTAGVGLQQALVNADQAPLRFGGDRFTARITWRDFLGNSGSGKAAVWTEDSGFFWFFQPSNVEVMVKVLDGRSINNSYWVFVGSLSNVEFKLTVRDEWTGIERVYDNPLGNFASFGDTGAFPGEPGATAVSTISSASQALTSAGTAAWISQAPADETAAAATPPSPAPQKGISQEVRVGDRFAITVQWDDGVGQMGQGIGRNMTGDTAAFNFFSPTNTELVIKVLDGRPINGHFWVFYGALSNVGYVIEIRDLETGARAIYQNPVGNFGSVGDITAF